MRRDSKRATIGPRAHRHNGFSRRRTPPQAAGGSTGFSGAVEGGADIADRRAGRSRELSWRKGNTSAAPTRLRLSAGFADTGEEEGLLAIRDENTPGRQPCPSATRPRIAGRSTPRSNEHHLVAHHPSCIHRNSESFCLRNAESAKECEKARWKHPMTGVESLGKDLPSRAKRTFHRKSTKAPSGSRLRP